MQRMWGSLVCPKSRRTLQSHGESWVVVVLVRMLFKRLWRWKQSWAGHWLGFQFSSHSGYFLHEQVQSIPALSTLMNFGHQLLTLTCHCMDPGL